MNQGKLAGIDNFDPGAWEKKIPRNCLLDRDETILELCKGKRVLHLGAADYPFHTNAAQGTLLHQKISGVADYLVGIDDNREAVEYLRVNHGIDNIIHADATNTGILSDERIAHGFDVLLCCDIIEHVENPGYLIESCKRLMDENTVLVVTTINATSIKASLRALLGREAVHNDHVAYYSYSTLCQLLSRKSLAPTNAGFFFYGTRLWITGFVFTLLGKLSPGIADGIILACRKSSNG